MFFLGLIHLLFGLSDQRVQIHAACILGDHPDGCRTAFLFQCPDQLVRRCAHRCFRLVLHKGHKFVPAGTVTVVPAETTLQFQRHSLQHLVPPFLWPLALFSSCRPFTSTYTQLRDTVHFFSPSCPGCSRRHCDSAYWSGYQSWQTGAAGARTGNSGAWRPS